MFAAEGSSSDWEYVLCDSTVGPTLAGGIDLQTSLHQLATHSHSKLLHNIFSFNIFLAVQTFSLNIFYRRKQKGQGLLRKEEPQTYANLYCRDLRAF